MKYCQHKVLITIKLFFLSLFYSCNSYFFSNLDFIAAKDTLYYIKLVENVAANNYLVTAARLAATNVE